ncbi:hypothetical protein WN943_009534 [Citrus x changshan-huyou]
MMFKEDCSLGEISERQKNFVDKAWARAVNYGPALAIARNAQYHIHKAAHGRLKHIANDMWDMAMERRDKKLIEQLFNTSSN